MSNYLLNWKENNLFINGLLNQVYLRWLIPVNNVIFISKEWLYYVYIFQIIMPVHNAGKGKANLSAKWLCIFLPSFRAARQYTYLPLPNSKYKRASLWFNSCNGKRKYSSHSHLRVNFNLNNELERCLSKCWNETKCKAKVCFGGLVNETLECQKTLRLYFII